MTRYSWRQPETGHDGFCCDDVIAVSASDKRVAQTQQGMERMELCEIKVLGGFLRGFSLGESHEFRITFERERCVSPNIFPAQSHGDVGGPLVPDSVVGGTLVEKGIQRGAPGESYIKCGSR